MKNLKMKSGFAVLVILMLALMVVGCSGSDESTKEADQQSQTVQPSATEMMQKEMVSLKEENASLKNQIAKLEQDNRAATARAAEMETQLAEVREHLTSTPPPSPKPAVRSTSSNERDSYDQALNLFRSRKYGEAASMFEGVLEGGSAGDLESNCHYWLGECSYAMKNYTGALGHLQKVFGYAKTSKKDDAQLMIANCYFAMGDKARAKAEYQKLIDKYPASPYVKRAKDRLEQL